MSENMAPALQDESRGTRVIERPDGYYWQVDATGEIFGPFATLEEAISDMYRGTDADLEVGETVEEAEAELGIADWIDEDTGLPAEDGVPHLKDD